MSLSDVRFGLGELSARAAPKAYSIRSGKRSATAASDGDCNVHNSAEHLGGRYDRSGSPLARGSGYRADVVLAAYDTKSVPIGKGTVPAHQDDASLKQWWNDVPQVNQTFTSVLELAPLGSNAYRYATRVRRLNGDFLPLDALNPAQKPRDGKPPTVRPAGPRAARPPGPSPGCTRR